MFYEFEYLTPDKNAYKQYGENFNFSQHLHRSFEFITVLSGEMEVTVDNKSYRLSDGLSLIVFPNQVHSLSSTKSRHLLYIFSPELVGAYTQKVLGKLPADNSFRPDKYLINALDNICEDASDTEKKGLLYSLCSQFDKTANYQTRKDDNKNLMYKIFNFVDLNYANDCSLNNLSRETGFSYSYLSRYFKKTVGISFCEYVNSYKINKACYLLTNSDNSILQCAMDSGYSSLRSFNRNFVSHLSITPGEYRKIYGS